jgi:hypothetical protein
MKIFIFFVIFIFKIKDRMNRNFLIILLIAFLSLNNLIDCIKINKIADFKQKNQHKIKTVHYALKEDNLIRIKSVGVKNTKFEPYENWLAKGIWIGDNYNQTG